MSDVSQSATSARGCFPPSDGLDYVREHYGVEVAIGQRVRCNGVPGTVVWEPSFGSHYVHVEFDATDERPAYRSPCHPTWEMEYL